MPLRLLLLLGLSTLLAAQPLALTFDDGPSLRATPLLSPEARNRALLDHLARAGAPAALFVTLARGADRPEGMALLRAWSAAGHRIGNHTVSHPDLNAEATSLEAYQAEILACGQALSALPGHRPWFRFTYLREGNTPAKRDGLRAFLRARGLRNASVSLDTSDWRLEEVLLGTLARRPGADLGPIREAYVAHLRQRAAAYRDLSRRLLGRDIPQVMLLHHNLVNALFLGDALKALRGDGWTLVDPDTAYADEVYRSEPDRPAPGQSLLLSLARSRGWKLLPEFERLMDDGDQEAEQLRKLGYGKD